MAAITHTRLRENRRNRLSVEIPAPGQFRNSLTSPLLPSVKETRSINRRSTWFGKAFDSIGNDGEIDKILFVKATRDIDVSTNYQF